MGMMTFRPGQRLVIPGVQVFQPWVTSAAAATWWDNNGAISGCVAAYQPKGSASLAASYTNLTGNATYNAAPGVAPTWDATGGWTFNGATQYLTTGYVASSGNSSYIVRFSDTESSGSRTILGWQNAGTPLMRLVPVSSGTSREYRHGSSATALIISGQIISGVMAIAGTAAYLNGSAETGSLPGGGSGNTLTALIGALSNGGTPLNFYAGKIQALAIYNVTLTAGQVATITTTMNLI